MEHEKEIASLLSVSESRGGAHRSLYLSSALRLVCAKHRGSPHTKKAPVKGVTIRETGVGEKLTPVFLSFTATLFRLRELKILLLFFCIRFQFLPFQKQ